MEKRGRETSFVFFYFEFDLKLRISASKKRPSVFAGQPFLIKNEDVLFIDRQGLALSVGYWLLPVRGWGNG